MEHSEELKEKAREVLMLPEHKNNVMNILKCTVCGVVIAKHPEKDCPEEQSKLEIVQENENNIARYINGCIENGF